ncbi:hypothetical protein [Pedobacter africanus]|uniref:Uncharacterized protein n=1 Tax=Pedobacter africanus TaxID=151894 RepID=A0A1W1ZCI8_9SPHI|nr:hypothetical protein [Pedobacter africanus]SMC46145.1 hypothetical protein SAMN04488524_0601 [Pedobacter africanus]
MKNLSNRQGYPMLLQLDLKVTKRDKETGTYYGSGTIDFTDDEPARIGDELKYNNKTIVITEVVDQREAKGLHPVPAIWQRIVCEFTTAVA